MLNQYTTFPLTHHRVEIVVSRLLFIQFTKLSKKARKDQNSTTIYLREGKYVLDKPLMLTSDDGNDSKELIIKNYPGEKTVLSSGIVLDLKWEKYKNGIMRAVVKGSPVMDMLFVNGELKSMARYPNYDEKAVRFNGTSALATAPERVKNGNARKGIPSCHA